MENGLQKKKQPHDPSTPRVPFTQEPPGRHGPAVWGHTSTDHLRPYVVCTREGRAANAQSLGVRCQNITQLACRRRKGALWDRVRRKECEEFFSSHIHAHLHSPSVLDTERADSSTMPSSPCSTDGTGPAALPAGPWTAGLPLAALPRPSIAAHTLSTNSAGFVSSCPSRTGMRDATTAAAAAASSTLPTAVARCRLWMARRGLSLVSYPSSLSEAPGPAHEDTRTNEDAR